MKGLIVALTVFVLALGLAPASVSAQAGPSVRPPGAEDALKRGFAMAQRQRWGLAIRYFGNAQKLAPLDPVVLFNLALANDRAPGRNVVAAAWYRAYLAAAPNAQNAEKVRARIVDLEIETEALVLDMLETALTVSAQLKGTPRLVALSRIAGAQAIAGNTVQAQQIAAQLGSKPQAAWAHARIAAAHAAKGNVAVGVSVASKIQHRRARNWALAEVAVQQAIRKEFAAAMETAAGAAKGPDRDFAFSRIAALQAMSGDAAGANAAADQIGEKALAYRLVANTAAAIPLSKSELPWIAEKAKKYLSRVLAEVQQLKKADAREIALLQVVRAHAGTNNFASAAEAEVLISNPRFKHLAAVAIAEAQGKRAIAGIHHWSALAVQAGSSPTMGDVASLLERAKTGAPAETVRLVAGAAEERTRFLEVLQTPLQ